jgi:hypothetical protein
MENSKEITPELLDTLKAKLFSVEQALNSAEDKCESLRLERNSLRSVIGVMSESKEVSNY